MPREADTSKVENFLKGYRLNRKFLELERYEKEFPGVMDDGNTDISEVAFARPKMYEVRHFVMGLKNSEEKLLLYYHYIKGISVERCSELLGMSRSSGYRLKKRALVMASKEAVRKNIY